MPKINLTPEDKARLIEAMNNGTEPSPDLLPKLFPVTAEKFDVKALDRAKIPTLEYAGKRSKAAILAEAGVGIGAAPLQTVRCFGETKGDEWKNLIVQGDNLQFLKTCYKNVDPLIKDKVKGQVKLIYIDPPFATKSDFGGNDGEYSYSDKADRAVFLETLRERLYLMREILADDGSIYVHLDQKMSHYIKIVMDEVFGKDNFRSEILWCYSSPGRSPNTFANKHNPIFWYTRKNSWIFNGDDVRIPMIAGNTTYNGGSTYGVKVVEKDGKRYRVSTSAGKEYWYDIDLGKIPENWWTDIQYLQQQVDERKSISYPTQKPEKLLERIVRASSNDNDVVMDCFAGSGTTGAVAEKLGRRWIMCDFGKHAIYTMQKRTLNISESKKFGKDIKVGEKYGQGPKPFCVVSSGAYDFTHVMDLRKHKETYIDFVLGLFQLARDEEKAGKYKLANIYAVKDNNPVEVYPIWDDQFLKEVKIDEAYLRGIITQSGRKLRGEYYIVTPESCANIGNATLKNQDGKDVHFQMLTFPYKVLEDISRNLELQEQPSSKDNVNNLITSTAFYFNEDVKLEAKRTSDGLKITKFETKILNREGKRFGGISGLAMLLVDLDYRIGKPFDMDKTVFAKEIAEDGSMKIEGITKSVGLIAIDKHGNESKPFNLK